MSIVTNEKPAVWATKQVLNTECLGKCGTQKCDTHGTALFTEGTSQKKDSKPGVASRRNQKKF